MNQRTLAKTAASSTALLVLLAACGPDGTDTVSSQTTPNDTGGTPTTQTPTTVRTPHKIKIGTAGNTAGGARAESAPVPAADQTGTDGKMIAPGIMPIRQVTYTAGPGLADLTGAKGSWFFPKDGYHVSDAQKAALVAALGVQGTWAPLPADWGGGEGIGPNDGTAPNITISTDAMASWWFNPGPGAYPASEPCTTTKDSSGQDVPSCPTPVPPANVPDKAAAEAKARDLFTSLGYDMANYELDSYADEWNAWVTAYLLLDGQRTPVSMYIGFGGDGVVTGAGGFLATPIQGDQYDLVGIATGIARLNDQQYGWIGMGGAMAKSAEGDIAAGAGTAGSSGTADDTVAPDASVDTAPMPVDPIPCDIAIRPAGDVVTSDPAQTDPNAGCGTVDVQPVTVELTTVKADLTMVWDAEGTIWLLPAYTFGDKDGGIYTVIAIDDAFIELPAPVEAPVPEPAVDPAATQTDDTSDGGATTEPPAAGIVIDQASADTLIGLSEDEAIKAAESKGWAARVVVRDGESLPVTADYRTDRVDFTVEGGLVTSVTIG